MNMREQEAYYTEKLRLSKDIARNCGLETSTEIIAAVFTKVAEHLHFLDQRGDLNGGRTERT